MKAESGDNKTRTSSKQTVTFDDATKGNLIDSVLKRQRRSPPLSRNRPKNENQRRNNNKKELLKHTRTHT